MNTHFSEIEDMFAREDAETVPYAVSVLGDSYEVLPGVFSPKVRANCAWYAEKVPALVGGGAFLEIGSGAGILAIRAAKRGCRVVATDIDPLAVRNTRLNAGIHGVEVDARLGSVYQPLGKEEAFDAIFWNHPWIYTEEKVDARHRVSYDQGYAGIEAFIRQGRQHLAKGGRLLIGTGSLARVDLIHGLAAEEGYGWAELAREEHVLAVGGRQKAEFLLCELQA